MWVERSHSLQLCRLCRGHRCTYYYDVDFCSRSCSASELINKPNWPFIMHTWNWKWSIISCQTNIVVQGHVNTVCAFQPHPGRTCDSFNRLANTFIAHLSAVLTKSSGVTPLAQNRQHSEAYNVPNLGHFITSRPSRTAEHNCVLFGKLLKCLVQPVVSAMLKLRC